MVTALLTSLLTVVSCADSATDPAVGPNFATASPGGVSDLHVVSSSTSTLTVSWTQVDDGSGQPASYRVKYAPPPLGNWKNATVGCQPTLPGTVIGAALSCTIVGLAAELPYDVQLMSFRVQNGAWANPKYSNVAKGVTTSTATDTRAPAISGVSISNVSTTGVSVHWTTDEPAVGRVEYGTTSPGQLTSTTESTMATSHSVALSALQPGTSYLFRVTARDSADNESVSATGTFTTDKAPAISAMAVSGVSSSGATVGWATDEPAMGRVEYGRVSTTELSSAETSLSTTHSRALADLEPATSYVYRVTAEDAAGNSTVSATDTFTTQAAAPPAPSAGGIWISPAELAQLPTSGTAWNNLRSAADASCGSVDLADQEDATNVCVMAKALVFARIGGPAYRTAVVDALRQITLAGVYNGRALSLGRELIAYVIAADLIDLGSLDPVLDVAFRTTLRVLLIAPTTEAGTLQQCHERRPNNWGTHCGASRAAIAAYLGDEVEMARVAQVFRGWLGDRSAYAGFTYGDLAWQCDPSRPVGINPAGCTRNGYSIDGVVADDQRRAGGFSWPPPRENYVWEALQGAMAQAVILERAGHPAFQWGDQALRRAVRWLHDQAGFPAEGDDSWQPYLVNRVYGTSFPAPVPSRPGKNVGWTDWTHGR